MDPNKLLTRDWFREGVFERDNHICVFCDAPAVDAHHILERRLFSDGGYYISNGASVCREHHLMCEMTTISVQQVRDACGITNPVIPEHLYRDVEYDKWGNPCMTNGTRLKGELFDDPSVQKILKQGGVLGSFVHHVKYPRTYHLPWSPGMTKDDRMIPDMSHFYGQRVIVTEKMDGENTSMYSDWYHARSVDSANHPSRNLVKAFWGSICGDIPPEWRVCGENLYAKHSIYYDQLPSYFMGFSIWNESNVCLDYDETVEWFKLLGINHTPVLYDGIYNEELIRNLPRKLGWDMEEHEGYVIRVAGRIPYSQFKHLVGKVVRRNHVGTDQHWMRGKPITPNQLAK